MLGSGGSLGWEAHGSAAAALPGLSCNGVEEELAGVLQAEMPKTTELKLFGVPGRGRSYSLIMSALSKLCFSCH